MSWGTHPLGLGYAPSQDRAGVPSRQNSTVSTCYTTGGMPLEFTQGDFLVENISSPEILIVYHVCQFAIADSPLFCSNMKECTSVASEKITANVTRSPLVMIPHLWENTNLSRRHQEYFLISSHFYPRFIFCGFSKNV